MYKWIITRAYTRLGDTQIATGQIGEILLNTWGIQHRLLRTNALAVGLKSLRIKLPQNHHHKAKTGLKNTKRIHKLNKCKQMSIFFEGILQICNNVINTTMPGLMNRHCKNNMTHCQEKNQTKQTHKWQRWWNYHYHKWKPDILKLTFWNWEARGGLQKYVLVCDAQNNKCDANSFLLELHITMLTYLWLISISVWLVRE